MDLINEFALRKIILTILKDSNPFRRKNSTKSEEKKVLKFID